MTDRRIATDLPAQRAPSRRAETIRCPLGASGRYRSRAVIVNRARKSSHRLTNGERWLLLSMSATPGPSKPVSSPPLSMLAGPVGRRAKIDAGHGLGSRFSAHDDRNLKSTRKPLREDFLIVFPAVATTVACGFLADVAARLAAKSASWRSAADDETWSEPASDMQMPKQWGLPGPDRDTRQTVNLSCDSECWTPRIQLSLTIDQDSWQDQPPVLLPRAKSCQESGWA